MFDAALLYIFNLPESTSLFLIGALMIVAALTFRRVSHLSKGASGSMSDSPASVGNPIGLEGRKVGS